MLILTSKATKPVMDEAVSENLCFKRISNENNGRQKIRNDVRHTERELARKDILNFAITQK
ncbi:CLUMA_CG018652, isoform A [Clunio marinus]|uniref:CLUMA_CG018652, isoform A n=1 Tax=Clunio marinus TaxID=568069 RepID=A0A1J1IZD7_9DIPT|nr:CLUMA_CG018652, isoform A [Clunio marinus]